MKDFPPSMSLNSKSSCRCLITNLDIVQPCSPPTIEVAIFFSFGQTACARKQLYLHEMRIGHMSKRRFLRYILKMSLCRRADQRTLCNSAEQTSHNFAFIRLADMTIDWGPSIQNRPAAVGEILASYFSNPVNIAWLDKNSANFM